MNQAQNVSDILCAIRSVKSRAREAMAKGDLAAYSSLMFDLIALEQCLVTQTELLIAS